MLPFLTASRTLQAREISRIASTNATTAFSLSEHSSSFEQDRSYDLPSLVELSLANNPYTRSAWFNALAAKASVGQARAPYYPTLKFNTSGGYSQMPYPTQNGPLKVNTTSISPGLQLEYILLDFGRRAADVRHTTALLQAANLDFNRRMQTTLFAVQELSPHRSISSSQKPSPTGPIWLPGKPGSRRVLRPRNAPKPTSYPSSHLREPITATPLATMPSRARQPAPTTEITTRWEALPS